MGDGGLFETQRDDMPAIEAELHALGLTDAHEIGRGGFGVVYRCQQPSLDRAVAVKVLTKDLDEENRARFFREQRAMGRLTGHPNIVNVLKVEVTASGHPLIVMPYHPLGSLESLIRRSGPLSIERVLRLGVKMAGAVATAHRLEILHRDVKPANILLSSYGEPALTDFGIAHIMGGFETAAGIVIASPAYTPPEILRGDPPTPMSDIYSLGATLFCAVTGHAAFERRHGEQVVAQFVRVSSQAIPDTREYGIPEELATVIDHAMSRDPHDRPPRAEAFGDLLQEIQIRNGLAADDMALPDDDGAIHVRRHSATSTFPTSNWTHTPAPLPKSAGNLPLDSTSFIGRQDELSTAQTMLKTRKLLTLTGIGGVGKTRLALRLAADLRRRFPHGVWLAEFGELRDPSLVPNVVADSLRLRTHGADSAKEVIEFLAARHVLLVLDNCEHVIDAVARFVQDLIRTCPDVVILATSREPLNVAGESVMRVPPMTMPDPEHEPELMGTPAYDAIAMFEDRASTAVPGFELSDDNLDTVVSICRHLDGLPLAIELAAARLRAMSLDQVLRRLTDRYALLTRGTRAAPTRQQTLRLCVEWSYDLCTPIEQRIWTQMSVFSGSFEYDAAQNICLEHITPDELLDIVSSLVDKSILIREEHRTGISFRMLDTLRDFGREKALTSDEYRKLQHRHYDWYRRLALAAEADWIGPRQLDWLARLGREHSNLRDAMEFALSMPNGSDYEAGLRIAAALFPFWYARNLFSEGRYWFDRALGKKAEQATADRIMALCFSSVLAEFQGDFPTASDFIVSAREMIAEVDDPIGKAYMDHAEGLFALYSGDPLQASAHLETSLRLFSAGNVQRARVWTLVMLGVSYELRGRTAQAVTCYEEALSITESCGELVYRSHSLWGLGLARYRQSEIDQATQSLAQCLELCRLVEEPLVAAVCLEVVAWISGDHQDSERAAVLLGAAESLGSAVGSSPLLFHELRRYHTACERTTRELLGEQIFRARHRKGARMGLEKAISFALETDQRANVRTRTKVALTERERQVADLVTQGLSNKAIATKLEVPERTAQSHVDHIFGKLGVKSRKEIAAWVRAERKTHHR
ncbi:protein kinase (plasmid) [Rhodococcus sp. USK10]|uniref:protein kinase domain-containing protein n=1 Tax=Rhodococcus sp. USK10 TaxID=2789739 RepID=UPI001C5E7A69|nr:protein kinase [Rhodococcus sp. USK10]QYB00764.1 protein kinase [Rhodococcus sp. USK10]